MIEGIAKARSFAPAEGFTNLYAEQRLESDDAAAFVAGATVSVNRGLMAGISAHGDSVHILRRLEHAWFPIANITVAAEAGQPRVAISKTPSGLSVSAPGSSLLVDRMGDEAPGRGGQTRTAGAVSFHTTSDAVVISQHAALSERVESRSFATTSVLVKHHVRWVWVWDESNSNLLRDLLDRGLVEAHRDGNVVILRPPRA
jgi:hypothetical protein